MRGGAIAGPDSTSVAMVGGRRVSRRRGGKSRAYAAVPLASTVGSLSPMAAPEMLEESKMNLTLQPRKATARSQKPRFSAPRVKQAGRAGVAARMRATHQIQQPSKMN